MPAGLKPGHEDSPGPGKNEEHVCEHDPEKVLGFSVVPQQKAKSGPSEGIFGRRHTYITHVQRASALR